MKVSCAFILKLTGLGALDADEVDSSAEALNQRYLPINGCSAIIEVPVPANPTSSNWQEVIDKDDVLKWFKCGIPKYTALYPNIGLFVVSHGATGQVGGLDGSNLAALIKEFGFQNLRKISVVACTTGGEKIGKTVTLDQSFFGKLCKGLAPGLTPMVAAYTGYMTIGSSKSEFKSLHSQNGKQEVAQDEFKKLMSKARKIVRTKQGMGKNMATCHADAAWKAKQKVAYQYQNGAVQRIDLATWHDK